MNSQDQHSGQGAIANLPHQTLLAALRNRRSRRFGAGMNIPDGPLAYRSRFGPAPLTEDEEAALVFAACGITGPALADLCYARGQGGNIMAGLVGRTIASGDGIQSVALIVTNDQSTCLVRRPRDFPAAEIPQLIALSQDQKLTELYRRTRVQFKCSRSAPPLTPLNNINANIWSAHAAGTTCFLPINDLTLLYINGLLEIFNETTGAFILDERAGFRPAGLAKFARSRGCHLEDVPSAGRLATIKHVELMVAEFAAIEQGMMLQNLGLMSEALGLGGYPNFANHENAWFEALGFRMGSMTSSRYLGMGPILGRLARWFGKDVPVNYPLGLEPAGEPLLRPFCPPCFPSMRDAVEAVVALKFGPAGTFSPDNPLAPWRDGREVAAAIPKLSPAAVAATIAYCEYVWDRYGRFPAHLAPFRTVVAFQAAHLDAEFYDRFYQPEAVGENQRQDFARWSGNSGKPGAPRGD